jgi:hypothetical protein
LVHAPVAVFVVVVQPVLGEVVPCFIVLIGYVGTTSTCFWVVGITVGINVYYYCCCCCCIAPPTMAIEDVTVASFSIGGVASFLDASQKTCATYLIVGPSVVTFPVQH